MNRQLKNASQVPLKTLVGAVLAAWSLAAAAQVGGGGVGGGGGGGGVPVAPIQVMQAGSDGDLIIEQGTSSNVILSITQIGNGQQVGDRMAASGFNTGIQVQNSNNTSITINQDGLGGNRAKVLQIQSSDVTAFVMQNNALRTSNSTRNRATIEQRNASNVDARIDQAGAATDSTNTASILQQDVSGNTYSGGDVNLETSEVVQLCTPAGCVDESSTFQSGSITFLPNSTARGQAYVSQNGDANQASIEQTGISYAAAASVLQDGDRNVATLRQIGVTGTTTETSYPPNVLDGAPSVPYDQVYDPGTGDLVSWRQTLLRTTDILTVTSFAASYSSTNQQGNDNTATLLQQDTIHATGTIWQQGNNNQANITQDAAAYNVAAAVNQYGSLNIGNITQSAVWDSSAVISQGVSGTGVSGNNAGIEQRNGSNFAATILQYSDANTALIIQGDGVGAVSTGLIAQIRQEGGTVNNGQIIQTGVSNVATLHQNGDHNIGTITQSASNNTALLQQFGSSFNGSITQTGSNNYAWLKQE